MDLQLKAWEVPLRLSAGAFILNSGLAKLRADDAAAKQTHGFAAGAYPTLRGFVVDDVRDRVRRSRKA